MLCSNPEPLEIRQSSSLWHLATQNNAKGNTQATYSAYLSSKAVPEKKEDVVFLLSSWSLFCVPRVPIFSIKTTITVTQ